MGSGQKFLTRVRSDQFLVARVWLGWVSHLWFGFGKFPLKMSIFFPLGQKKNLVGLGQKVPGSKAGGSLIYCGSKVCSVQWGQGPSQQTKLNSRAYNHLPQSYI